MCDQELRFLIFLPEYVTVFGEVSPPHVFHIHAFTFTELSLMAKVYAVEEANLKRCLECKGAFNSTHSMKMQISVQKVT